MIINRRIQKGVGVIDWYSRWMYEEIVGNFRVGRIRLEIMLFKINDKTLY